MSSNIGQSYPYSSETDEQRSAAVAAAFAAHEGLEARVADESLPIADMTPGENGAPVKWWVWVCRACIDGRLHVAGYARDRHALYAVCDRCGATALR